MGLERKGLIERMDGFLVSGNKGLAGMLGRVVDERNLRGTLYAPGAGLCNRRCSINGKAVPLVITAANVAGGIRTADKEVALTAKNPNKREKISLAIMYILGGCTTYLGLGFITMGALYHNKSTLYGGLVFLTNGLDVFSYAAAEYIGRPAS